MELQTTPMQSRLQKRKKGFTLTEIAIVLGIIGLILGAIWVAAASVYNNQRINQGQTAILQTLQGIRTLYAQQASITAGNDTPAMINAGIIPTNLISAAGNTMQAPWGGVMMVGGDTTGAAIVIEFGGMTSALCTGIIAAVFGASHDRTLDTSSTVGGTTLGAWVNVTTNATAVGNLNMLPTANGAAGRAAPSAAGTACQAGAVNNSALLVFGLQG